MLDLNHCIINAHILLVERWNIATLEHAFDWDLAARLWIDVYHLDDREVLAGIRVLTDRM